MLNINHNKEKINLYSMKESVCVRVRVTNELSCIK